MDPDVQRLVREQRLVAAAELASSRGDAETASTLFERACEFHRAAEEALRAGLVNRVVPATDLEHDVRAVAQTIAQNAPLTVRACKVAIREAQRPVGERDRARVDALVEACFRSADYLEGQAAFAEKRHPHFEGR